MSLRGKDIAIHIYGCPTTEAIESFAVARGSSVALIGPNGSGKTSLLRYIAFGRAPYPVNLCRGTVNGIPIEMMENSGRGATRVSYIPSEKMVFPELTVEENIKIGMIAGGIPRADRRSVLEEIYNMFPLLKSRRNQLAGTLSGGEQKILSIARALSTRAEILLVDEPSAGLSPKAIDMVYEIFRSLRSRGITLVIAEQSIWPLVRNIGVIDSIYIISDMKIVSSQRPEELLTSDIARKYFGLKR